MTAEARAADFTIQDHGSICLLCPQTEAGTGWMEEHISRDSGYQPYWPNAALVERRYLEDIVDGIESDGLEVEGA